MTSSTTVQIPGYVAGAWDIDPTHSTVGFSVRHMMVSKVRGYFREFSGELVTAENPTQSSVTATVNMDSIDTRQEQRDAHIRSADFFDVGNHTELTFRSTEVDVKTMVGWLSTSKKSAERMCASRCSWRVSMEPSSMLASTTESVGFSAVTISPLKSRK